MNILKEICKYHADQAADYLRETDYWDKVDLGMSKQLLAISAMHNRYAKVLNNILKSKEILCG